MKLRLFLFITNFIFFNCDLAAQVAVPKGDDISYMGSGGKLNPLQAIMDIRHYTLALNVDIAQQSIDGYTTIDLLLLQ